MVWATAAGSGWRRLRRLGNALHRIRYRLLLVNIIVAIVPIAGVRFADRYEDELLDGLETDMIHQAQLVRASLIESKYPPPSFERMLVSAARETRTRIRVLDERGELVADSHRNGPPEGPELPTDRAASTPQPIAQLGERREIKLALAGRYGSATRLWDHHDRVYLFSALPVIRDGRVEGVVYVTRSTQQVKHQLYRLRDWLAHLALATLAVTALVSLIFATTIARPLSALTTRARGVVRVDRACQQDIARLTKRRDEIGELARAFEATTAELERRAHQARTLASDISHEFKTPLTGIRGAAELLRDGAVDDDPLARERFLAMILEDSERLARLVTRLLELARVDDDTSARSPVDVAAIARECARRPWRVGVRVAGADQLVVEGRAHQLASAIDNLVANACHFAVDGSTVVIEIGVESVGDVARVAVSNHGPAMSLAARERAWDRFYSTRTASGGTGLGLAIVRSVAVKHGGSVGIDCANGVTTVWFTADRG